MEKNTEEEDAEKTVVIVCGYWIEEEIRKIEKENLLETLGTPVLCRLGILKTNPNKRKFRLCDIFFKTPTE